MSGSDGRGRGEGSEKAVEMKRRLTIYVKVRVSRKLIVDSHMYADDSSRLVPPPGRSLTVPS